MDEIQEVFELKLVYLSSYMCECFDTLILKGSIYFKK